MASSYLEPGNSSSDQAYEVNRPNASPMPVSASDNIEDILSLSQHSTTGPLVLDRETAHRFRSCSPSRRPVHYHRPRECPGIESSIYAGMGSNELDATMYDSQGSLEWLWPAETPWPVYNPTPESPVGVWPNNFQSPHSMNEDTDLMTSDSILVLPSTLCEGPYAWSTEWDLYSFPQAESDSYNSTAQPSFPLSDTGSPFSAPETFLSPSHFSQHSSCYSPCIGTPTSAANLVQSDFPTRTLSMPGWDLQRNEIDGFHEDSSKVSHPSDPSKGEDARLLKGANESHTPLRPRSQAYSCPFPQCSRSFGRASDMRKHQKVHIDKDKRPYPCIYCDTKFLDQRDLDRHVQSSHNTAPRSNKCPVSNCEFASKGFFRTDKLKQHMRRRHHSTSTPSISSQATGTRESSPADMMKLAEGSVSSTADLTFSKSMSSQKCPYCDKVIGYLSDYKKHLQTHERPYLCDLSHCTRQTGFATDNDLRRHKKSVHELEISGLPGKTYRCAAKGCRNWDKIWLRLDNFRQHVIKMHSEQSLEEVIQQSKISDLDTFSAPSDVRSQSPLYTSFRVGPRKPFSNFLNSAPSQPQFSEGTFLSSDFASWPISDLSCESSEAGRAHSKGQYMPSSKTL